MTGHKGNSEFCFPETLTVPRGEAEGNIEVEGKQNSLFPEGPVIKCFVIPAKTNLFYRKVTITVYFFAANKNYRQYLSCFGLF